MLEVRALVRALKRGNACGAKGRRKIDRERTNNLEEPPDLIVPPVTSRTVRRFSGDNLYSASREVAANKGAPGVDNITIEDFTAVLDRNVTKLEQQLREGTYTPQSIKRVHIPKPGTNETRPLAPLWMNTGLRL